MKEKKIISASEAIMPLGGLRRTKADLLVLVGAEVREVTWPRSDCHQDEKGKMEGNTVQVPH